MSTDEQRKAFERELLGLADRPLYTEEFKSERLEVVGMTQRAIPFLKDRLKDYPLPVTDTWGTGTIEFDWHRRGAGHVRATFHSSDGKTPPFVWVQLTISRTPCAWDLCDRGIEFNSQDDDSRYKALVEEIGTCLKQLYAEPTKPREDDETTRH